MPPESSIDRVLIRVVFRLPLPSAIAPRKPKLCAALGTGAGSGARFGAWITHLQVGLDRPLPDSLP